MYPPGAPPIDVDGPGPATQREPSSARRASMKRREENLHRMLAISDTLAIARQGATLDIVSAVESRRVVAGSRTQVSMPEGELADSNVGWDGQWFVIDRRVRGGPRVVEKVPARAEDRSARIRDEVVRRRRARRHEDPARVRPRDRDAAAGRSGGGPE